MRLDPTPDEHPMAELQQYIVESAMPLFTQHLLQEPRAAKRALARRDAAAKRVLDAFKTAEWQDGIRTLIEHQDVVDHKLWEEAFYELERAAVLLPLTGHADRFAREQMDPFFYQLAKEELDPEFRTALEKELSEEDARDFIEGWKSLPDVGESVMSIASQLSVATIAIGANLPGPMSLWVALSRVALFHAIAYKAAKGLTAGGLAGGILNRLVKWGSLGAAEQTLLQNAIQESYQWRDKPPTTRYVNTVKSLNIDLDDRLFRGAGLRGATFLVATALLVLTLTNDPLESYEHAVGLMSAMGGGVLAFADLKPIADVLMRRAPTVAVTGMSAVAASVSVFGIVAGVLTMRKGFARGDSLQALEGALGGTGSAVALGGWIAASVFAVPIPQYVMAVGTLLVLASIGAAVWGMIQDSVQAFVNGILEALEDPSSFAQRADLGSTVTLLRELVEATSFDGIPLPYRTDLEARGFPPDLAAELTA